MQTIKIPSRKKILQHFDQRDPVIAKVIRDFGPFQLKHNRNYFIVLCKAIIAQQISTAAADAITMRFYQRFKGSVPTSRRVHAMAEPVLREVGLSRQKVAYLKDLSMHFLEKKISPHKLTYLSNEEVIDQLTRVHGIGQWTAEMFLIFSLNRLDILPVGDLGLQAAIKNLYRMKTMPSVKKMRLIGKKWNPLETVGTWYAWRVRDERIIAY